MIDVFATLVLLFVVTVQTYTLFDKVMTTRTDNVLTFDLRLPTWPFFLIAWLGDVSAVLLIAVRTYRLVFHPDYMRPIIEADQLLGAQGKLVKEVARHLAVRMSYEDVVRVAQAKIAPARMYTRETLRIIDGIDMPKADKEKIWHGNLEAITGVKFRS